MTNSRYLAALGAAAFLLQGCTFINTFDPLVQRGDAGPDVEAPTPDAAPDAMDEGDVGSIDEPEVMDDAGGMMEAEPTEVGPPPRGAIVVSGTAPGDAGGARKLLLALDPDTGSELSREDLDVTGLAYDGYREDLFYIFERGSGTQDRLHVRKLETHSGTWTEIQTDVVPSFVGLDAAVLNQRVAYLHNTPDADGGTTQHVTVLSTSGADSAATKVKALNDVVIPDSQYTAVGLIGTPDPNKAGGTVDVVLV
jgi:hypothetical protein